jgi:hypothetical protein
VSATTVLLTLPGDVVQRAVRAAVEVGVAAVAAVPSLLGSAGTLGEYLKTFEAVAHENERHACPRCQKVGHEGRWRGYPVLDPGPCPPGDVLDDLLEVCACCFWGPSADPIYDRLQREAHDGRDIHVEHLDSCWTTFETRF